MIVVDCSALVAFFAAPDHNPNILSHIATAEAIAAPDFVALEFINALRRQERVNRLGHKAGLALADFQVMRIERYDRQDFVAAIWKLRHNFSAYDAAYVALAERLPAPFLSADGRLKRAVAEHTKIKLL